MNCLVYDEDVDEDNNVCMFVVVADNFPRKKLQVPEVHEKEIARKCSETKRSLSDTRQISWQEAHSYAKLLKICYAKKPVDPDQVKVIKNDLGRL